MTYDPKEAVFLLIQLLFRLELVNPTTFLASHYRLFWCNVSPSVLNYLKGTQI